MAALPLGSPASSSVLEKSKFAPALVLSPPTVPGLHPPDKPGAFLIQDFVPFNLNSEVEPVPNALSRGF
jgi:hypothetical protein